jgi:hypothetical protein
MSLTKGKEFMTYFCLKVKILKTFTKKKKMLLSNQVYMVHPKKRKEINNYFEAHVTFILFFQIRQT